MRADAPILKRVYAMPDGWVRAGDGTRWAGSCRPVETRRELPYGEFVCDYVRGKRPVVIKHGVRTDTITPQTIRAACSHRPLADLTGGGGSHVLVRGNPSALETFRSLVTLGEYLSRFEEDGSGLPYLSNLGISANFPELVDAFAPPPHLTPNWITTWPFSALGFEDSRHFGAEVFLGPAGATYGTLHYDRHALYVGSCQYYGKKTWWLCPPEQGRFLYPIGDYPHVSKANPFDLDLRQYPLVEQAEAFIVTLEAGDVMFVPNGWWHTTKAVTPNISTVHRILNRHNLAAYLWDLKHYILHDRTPVIGMLRRVFSRE